MCFDWKKYGIIPVLADKLRQRDKNFGKTALQKYVYILQTLYGVEIGYDFEMYTYGPYCSELHSNLDLVEHWGCVSVESDGEHGYTIHPGEYDNLTAKDSFFRHDNTGRAIDQLKMDFGGLYAKDLELRATLIYIDREYKRKNAELTEDKLCNTVMEIKPKFTKDIIIDAIEELKEKNFLLTLR